MTRMGRRGGDWGPDPHVCRSCGAWGPFGPDGDTRDDFNNTKHKKDCALKRALEIVDAKFVRIPT